jgi:DNA-binding CsgD family transcriptional regulator
MSLLSVYDMSKELSFCRFRNGITLARPDNIPATVSKTGLSLQDILDLSLNIYFLDTESRHRLPNEHTVSSCGFTSQQDAMGKSVLEIFSLETAHAILENDARTIKQGKLQILNEMGNRNTDQENIHSLSIKAPWYCNDGKIIGLLGFSIIHGVQPLAESLADVAKLGLLNQHHLPLPEENSPFTARERDLIPLILQNKNSKIIAEILSISARTVEHHVENIKSKLGASTKWDMLERLEQVYALECKKF